MTQWFSRQRQGRPQRANGCAETPPAARPRFGPRVRRLGVALALAWPLYAFSYTPSVMEARLRYEPAVARRAAAARAAQTEPGQPDRAVAPASGDAQSTVTLRLQGVSRVFATGARTVEEFFVEQRIGLGPLDRVSVALDAVIQPGMEIALIRVARDFENRDAAVPASTVLFSDPNLALDRQELRVKGENGVRRFRTRLIRYDGEVEARGAPESWLVRPSVSTTFAFGRKIAKSLWQTPEGETIEYWRKTRMYVTSYSAARAGTPVDAPWYGLTFSGEPMRNGIIAADLDVMPLGTRLYVPGYGIGDVLDTGGGLHGLHIDLGYADEDYVPWHGWVDVYWLWPPPSDPGAIVWILPAPESPR